MNDVNCWFGNHKVEYKVDSINTIVRYFVDNKGQRDVSYRVLSYEVGYCSHCKTELSRFPVAKY